MSRGIEILCAGNSSRRGSVPALRISDQLRMRGLQPATRGSRACAPRRAAGRPRSRASSTRCSSVRSFGEQRGGGARRRRDGRRDVRGRRRGRVVLAEALRVALLLLPRPARRAAATSSRVDEALRASRGPPARSANGCRRSVRCLSSPGVCGPRSMSTHSTASSSGARVSASSSRWRYFGARAAAGQPGEATAAQARHRVADRRRRRSATTGSRAVDWLHAIAQRVERERIGVRRRALLLDQAAQHADLGGREVHGSEGYFSGGSASSLSPVFDAARRTPAGCAASRESWWPARRDVLAGLLEDALEDVGVVRGGVGRLLARAAAAGRRGGCSRRRRCGRSRRCAPRP